jgi:hypothetical protein
VSPSPADTVRSSWAARVTFEIDEGQDYPVGTRVAVRAMDAAYRTLAVDPLGGEFVVARCERSRDAWWKALRVTLVPAAPATPVVDIVGASPP